MSLSVRGQADACREPSLFRRVVALSVPFWTGPQRNAAWCLFGSLLAARLAAVWLFLQMNAWYARFYAAIEARDSGAFAQSVVEFAVIAAGLVVLQVLAHFLSSELKLRWRAFEAARLSATWLGSGAFARLEVEDRAAAPEQRIADDVGNFTARTVDLVVGTIDVGVSLTAFSAVLWSLSGTVSLMGFDVPGTIFVAALVWTFGSSLVTHAIGSRLSALHDVKAGGEATFRFDLVRIRENAEAIAFQRGGARESERLERVFETVASATRAVVRRETWLGVFTHGYGHANVVLPFVLCMPRFFAGEIDFGQVMQIAAAFGAVQACLSYFISNYGQIALWRAEAGRLSVFAGKIAPHEETADLERRADGGGGLRVHGLTVMLPEGRPLLRDLDLEVAPGEAVLLRAPSGTGKSTMLRTLAGLWPYATGTVDVVTDEAFFMPQRPYLPTGSLRRAVAYPNTPPARGGLVEEALVAVGLGHLVARLDEEENWSATLSGGEQQRIAFARVLVSRPAIVFLDEATSALDEANEARVYEILRTAPWCPALVSIGHRSSLVRLHDRVVDLVPAEAIPGSDRNMLIAA